ncbi:MAG: 50S ribosomal protein L2 [Candidatus Altiarchaeota archaeon]
MGKRLRQQRRGRGGPRYRAVTHKAKGLISYPDIKITNEGKIGGQVLEILHDPIRSAPIAKVLLEDFNEIFLIAPEGMKKGQWIEIGSDAEIKEGNVLPLRKIPEGTFIYNIEKLPGDNGKFVRASGTSAQVISHDVKQNVTYVVFPSKKTVKINSNSRATIGKVAGGGRIEKPFVKAGETFYKYKAINKVFPMVRGVAKNPVDHPHGGGGHKHVGRPTSVSRDTPPGRKVGHLAPKRTGKKKK